MKVRCNNKSGTWIRTTKNWIGKKKEKTHSNGPKQGNVCTVIDERWEDGIKYYKLLEWPQKESNWGWSAKSFDPITEQYETVSYSELVADKAPSVN